MQLYPPHSFVFPPNGSRKIKTFLYRTKLIMFLALRGTKKAEKGWRREILCRRMHASVSSLIFLLQGMHDIISNNEVMISNWAAEFLCQRTYKV